MDPFADGVLLILIGRGATRQMETLLKLKKSYRALLQLGSKTESADTEGDVIETREIPVIDDLLLQQVSKFFVGEYLQTPPQHSAKKVRGRPAYKYVRKGESVELKPKKVQIYNLDIEKKKDDVLEFWVTCSSGTYIRVLGEEIAEKLGTVGYLTELTRESIGPYNLENAVQLTELPIVLQEEKKYLIEKETAN